MPSRSTRTSGLPLPNSSTTHSSPSTPATTLARDPPTLVSPLVSNPGIFLHLPGCEPSILGRQPSRRDREVREDKDGAYGNEDCQGAFDVEKPAPRSFPEFAVLAIEDPGRNKGAESVGNTVPAEVRSPSAEFPASVPLAEEKERTRSKGCFDDAQEEAGEEGANEAVTSYGRKDKCTSVEGTYSFVSPVGTYRMNTPVPRAGND